MRRLGRIGLIALALAAVYLLLNGIGWAAVFFWKSEVVALCLAVPAMVICPAGAICVVPGSQADSPFFFIPLMVVFFLMWAVVIDAIWRKLKRTPNQAAHATSELAPGAGSSSREG
jgi:hypothetical protein